MPKISNVQDSKSTSILSPYFLETHVVDVAGPFTEDGHGRSTTSREIAKHRFFTMDWGKFHGHSFLYAHHHHRFRTLCRFTTRFILLRVECPRPAKIADPSIMSGSLVVSTWTEGRE